MLRGIIIVGLGGFLGSVSRYLTTHYIHKLFDTNFPLGTLIVNILGCLFIGFILGLFEKGSIVSADLRLFLTVGFCGGFTTFSTFTNDSINLANETEIFYLMLYIGFSIFIGISSTFIGRILANYIWIWK